MTQAMTSEEKEQLLTGYVLGDLDEAESEILATLLRQDPNLQTEIDSLQAILERAYGVPEVTPPSSLRAKILQRSEQSFATQSPPPALPGSMAAQRSTARRWGQWSGAIAALLILALGFNNYRLWQALKAARTEVSEYKTLVYALASTQANVAASAQVVVNPNTLAAELTVRNLPPLPAGQVYALWTVLQPGAPHTVDEKGAVLTGIFQVDAEGNTVTSVVVPEAYRFTDRVAKVAVTVENAVAPQTHAGTPILITQ